MSRRVQGSNQIWYQVHGREIESRAEQSRADKNRNIGVHENSKVKRKTSSDARWIATLVVFNCDSGGWLGSNLMVRKSLVKTAP